MDEFKILSRVLLYALLWVIMCKILELNNFNLVISTLIVVLLSLSAQLSRYLRLPVALGALWSLGVIAAEIPQPRELFPQLASKPPSHISSIFSSKDKNHQPSQLTSRLEQLKKARQSGLITENKYKTIRAELISNFTAKK